MKTIRAALASFVLLSVLTGLIYPLIITGIAQVLFPFRANGSMITASGKAAPHAALACGSSLIGQTFNSPGYFWSRPSATTPMPYNAASSAASNTGPSNPALVTNVKARIAALHAADPENHAAVPVDLVTSSGSGLDPDISIGAALYQVGRVARVRHLPVAEVKRLVAHYEQGRSFGIFGEPCVNVLKLNLALNRLAKAAPAR